MLKKTSVLLPVGITALLIGAATAYAYFMYLIHAGGLTVVVLFASVASVCVGLYFLNRAIASLSGLEKLVPVEDDLVSVPKDGPALENILSRNENMVKEWTDTNKTKDQLKMLEISASAQTQKN